MKIPDRPVIILGGGGHARVLADVLKQYGCSIIGITDPDSTKHGSSMDGVEIIGDDSKLSCYSVNEVLLVNAQGSVKGAVRRKAIFDLFKSKGFAYASVIHPSAIIASSVVLGEGVQVMAGTVIQAGSSIGDNTIVNTGVSVDHDCRVGMNVHLAPGVTISGEVTIDDNAHIGCGAVIIQRLHIGEGSVIGAGAVVLEDVQPRVTAVGIPAKVVKS